MSPLEIINSFLSKGRKQILMKAHKCPNIKICEVPSDSKESLELSEENSNVIDMNFQSSQEAHENNGIEYPLIDAKYKLIVHILCYAVITLSLIKVFNAVGDIANILDPRMAGNDRDLYEGKPIWPHICVIAINSVYIFGAIFGLIAVNKENVVYFCICIISSIIRISFSIIQIIDLCISKEFSIKSLLDSLIFGILISITIIIGSYILIKQILRIQHSSNN